MPIARALVHGVSGVFRRILLHRPLAVSACLHLAAVAGAVALVAGLPRVEAMLGATVLLSVLGAVSFTKLRFVLIARRGEVQQLHRRIRDFETKRELAAIELEATRETYKEAISNLVLANNAALENTVRSDRELDDLARVAAHDLKKPLRGIHHAANRLMADYRDRLGEAGRARLARLAELARWLDSRLDSLVRYSRIGRIELAPAMTSLAQVLDDVTAALQSRLEDPGVELRVPRPLPVLRCDAALLGEVFRHLISNAIQYNMRPTKRVEVGFHTREEIEREALDIESMASEPIVFYVKDNGIGIREQHYEAVFRLFKRLHGRDAFQGGTGAGLTIVRKIVERHGGRVWISSVFGAGTTFYFTLGDGARSARSPVAYAPVGAAG
ncbi:MAG: hypothetical protein JXQ29_11155 [Planctomycetes bacterium]|nr:hypothetical protein [Planctomycetota bacterium]